MKNSIKGMERKSRGNTSLGMFAIACVAVILLGTLSMESRKLSEKLAYYESRAVALEKEIEEEMNRTETIDDLKLFMQTDAFAEQVAREKLGLVKENEIVFVEQE